MIRNLKASGLALCAVFMFGAFSASGALAMNDMIKSPVAGETYVTGEQVGGVHANAFGTQWKPAVKLECATGKFTGKFPGPSATQVEVTPEYSTCKFAGVNIPGVDDEGCKFVLTGTTDAYTNTSGAAEGEKATVKLNCNHTGQIRITAQLGCVITLKDTSGANTVNQSLKGVTYDNEKEAGSEKWDVRVTFTVDKIHYTSSGCAFLGITATDNDGFLTANVTVRGYEEVSHGKQVDLTFS